MSRIKGIHHVSMKCTGGEELSRVRHVALCTGDVDACARAAAQAGYEVFLPPQNKSFPTDPPYTMRIAFCTGPLGEEVEFFCPLD